MGTDLLPVSAIVLAAGLSTRMGRSKLDLPWGNTSVIGQVITSLSMGGISCGLTQIVIVTGGARQNFEKAIQAVQIDLPIQTIENPHYASSNMLASVKTGLSTLNQVSAAMITLGDQPQIKAEVVKELLNLYQTEKPLITVPSYQMRRGHPWLVQQTLWHEIMQLELKQTLRDFLTRHERQIRYLEVETNTILQDLDTPEDYQRFQPSNQPG